ncbi:MAG: hypothetical protein AB8B46_02825 [Candidatus Midichloriaceae bacterium]
MKHYYSIANFAVGTITTAYDYLNAEYTDVTNQVVFGWITSWSQGKQEKHIKGLVDGFKPADFPYMINRDVLKHVAGEFHNFVVKQEHNDYWNGEAIIDSVAAHTPAFNLISDWSTITTAAGVLDYIEYITDRNFLSEDNPIDLPNIITQNIVSSGESAVLSGAAVVLSLGWEYSLMIPLSSKFFAASFSISTLPVIAQDILFSNYIPFALPASQIASLVEKYGIESIKPLHEAGAKFSRLESYEIEYLVGEYGSEIKDKLLHPESIQDEIIANDIESLTANNVEQLETIST